MWFPTSRQRRDRKVLFRRTRFHCNDSPVISLEGEIFLSWWNSRRIRSLASLRDDRGVVEITGGWSRGKSGMEFRLRLAALGFSILEKEKNIAERFAPGSKRGVPCAGEDARVTGIVRRGNASPVPQGEPGCDRIPDFRIRGFFGVVEPRRRGCATGGRYRPTRCRHR
uniref:Uncharacterized protein n=1 Tax=Candidatus Kentrum sp. SD TaxID=2126332 RepID=A0A451BN95_9GAMM|nr:MAG: hypothetical protein BECKSD772D_GA0070982_106313 [Candidatus Kentron sp. SD]